jgi:hypothetical protein
MMDWWFIEGDDHTPEIRRCLGLIVRRLDPLSTNWPGLDLFEAGRTFLPTTSMIVVPTIDHAAVRAATRLVIVNVQTYDHLAAASTADSIGTRRSLWIVWVGVDVTIIRDAVHHAVDELLVPAYHRMVRWLVNATELTVTLTVSVNVGQNLPTDKCVTTHGQITTHE